MVQCLLVIVMLPALVASQWDSAVPFQSMFPKDCTRWSGSNCYCFAGITGAMPSLGANCIASWTLARSSLETGTSAIRVTFRLSKVFLLAVPNIAGASITISQTSNESKSVDVVTVHPQASTTSFPLTLTCVVPLKPTCTTLTFTLTATQNVIIYLQPTEALATTQTVSGGTCSQGLVINVGTLTKASTPETSQSRTFSDKSTSSASLSLVQDSVSVSTALTASSLTLTGGLLFSTHSVSATVQSSSSSSQSQTAIDRTSSSSLWSLSPSGYATASRTGTFTSPRTVGADTNSLSSQTPSPTRNRISTSATRMSSVSDGSRPHAITPQRTVHASPHSSITKSVYIIPSISTDTAVLAAAATLAVSVNTAVTVLAASAAGGALMQASLGNSYCAKSASRGNEDSSSNQPTMYLISPFYGVSRYAMVLGNVSLVVLIVVLHGLATVVVQRLGLCYRAAEQCRFPNISINVAVHSIQGVALGGWGLLWDVVNPSDPTAAGASTVICQVLTWVFSVLYPAMVLLLLWRLRTLLVRDGCRIVQLVELRVNALSMRTLFGDMASHETIISQVIPTQELPKLTLLKLLAPQTFWKPRRVRWMFGAAFLSFAPKEVLTLSWWSIMWLAGDVLLLPIVTSVASTTRPSVATQWAACNGVMLASGILFLLYSVALALARPYRIGARNLLSPMVIVWMSVTCLLATPWVAEALGPESLNTALGSVSVLQSVTVLLLAISEVAVFFTIDRAMSMLEDTSLESAAHDNDAADAKDVFMLNCLDDEDDDRCPSSKHFPSLCGENVSVGSPLPLLATNYEDVPLVAMVPKVHDDEIDSEDLDSRESVRGNGMSLLFPEHAATTVPSDLLKMYSAMEKEYFVV